MARDDQYVIPETPGVKILEHGQGVWPNTRQERVSCPVEELQRRDVRPEIPVRHELLNRLGVGSQGTRRALIPEAVRVPDAVGTVQRAPLDVIQAQAALSVLDDFTRT